MIPSRQLRWWLLFGAGLLVAIAGWTWIMVRLVRSESEAAQAQVRQVEERLLTREARDLTLRIEQAIQSPTPITELAKSDLYSGWWSDLPPLEVVENPTDSTLDDWRQRIRTRQVQASDLKKAMDHGTLGWKSQENGRDPVASLLPTLFRQGERSQELKQLLGERVWNDRLPPLSPAFRLTLIRPLLEMDSSEELQRLLDIETIRSARGRLGEQDTAYEVIESQVNGSTLMTFWTKNQLLNLLDSPGDYQLLENPPDGRASTPVRGLQKWPFLASGRSLTDAAESHRSNPLIWIGGASGLTLLALALVAVLFGRHQLKLARMRTDLAASVAHELRTPLAGQRLLLESLTEVDRIPNAQRQEYIAMALRENKRLGSLAEEFLTFSRLDRGVLQLEREQVAVADVIDGAVESLREKWEDPGCRLTLSIPADLPQILGDRQALTTVLRNLLENAWKYSNDPREIEVNASTKANEILITVADNGIGLTPGEQQRIFRQFYQVDQRLARTRDGLGLGLFIVRRLLESMDGRVEIESRHSEGSRFTIHIPIAE